MWAFTDREREKDVRDIKKIIERKRKLRNIGLRMYEVASKDGW